MISTYLELGVDFNQFITIFENSTAGNRRMVA